MQISKRCAAQEACVRGAAWQAVCRHVPTCAAGGWWLAWRSGLLAAGMQMSACLPHGHGPWPSISTACVPSKSPVGCRRHLHHAAPGARPDPMLGMRAPTRIRILANRSLGPPLVEAAGAGLAAAGFAAAGFAAAGAAAGAGLEDGAAGASATGASPSRRSLSTWAIALFSSSTAAILFDRRRRTTRSVVLKWQSGQVQWFENINE